MGLLVAAVIIWLLIAGTRNMKSVPGRLQNFVEFALDGLRNLYMGLLGPNGAPHVPVVVTLFLYIILCNLLSVTPMRAPTANLSTNLGLACFVLFYVQYWAIKSKGIGGYLKHFLGPLWWLTPLFLLTETVGMFAQPFSLAMRLYGNIFGEDDMSYIAYNAANHTHIPAQVLVYFLMLFTGILQAFVFTLLTSAYIGMATHTDHVDNHGHSDLPERVENSAYIPAA